MEDMKVIEQAHFRWFQEELIDGGAPVYITEDQVKASAGYNASLRAFEAGWRILAHRIKAASR